MFFDISARLASNRTRTAFLWGAGWLALSVAIFGGQTAWGDDVSTNSKLTIGATATLTETSSGLSFPARIDTGAQTCSLHVEKYEIKDPHKFRVRNAGKTVRLLLKNAEGKTEWVETEIVKAIRVKSSSLKSGEYDHRYKVRLTLKWKDFEKKVLVTINDRTDMEYPLLIGRNFLRGDFVVDVDKKD